MSRPSTWGMSRWIVCSLVLVGVWGSALTPAWASALGLDPDGYYEVIYQLSNTEARSIKPVKVLELIKVGNRDFLVIEPVNFPQRTKGYLAFERISAILPTQVTGFPRVDSMPATRSATE